MFTHNGQQFETVEEVAKDILNAVGGSMKRFIVDNFVRQPRSMIRAVSGSATLATMGVTSATVGTGTVKLVSAGTEYAFAQLVEYLQATSGQAGWRYGRNNFYLSNVSHRGGFGWVQKFGLATGNASAGKRFLIGYSPDLAWVTTTPSTVLNSIFVSFQDGDTNFFITHNGASGTATRIDTGIPIPTTDRSQAFEASIIAKPNGTSVEISLTRLGATPLTFKTTITDATKLPAVNVFLSPKIQRYDAGAVPLGLGISDGVFW